MQIDFTENVENGKNLNVDDYLLYTATGIEPFKMASANAKSNMTKDEFIKIVTCGTALHEQNIQDTIKKQKVARRVLSWNQLGAEMFNLEGTLVEQKDKLRKYQVENDERSRIASALVNNLPGGKVGGEAGISSPTEPDEMETLFGTKYKGFEENEKDPAEKIKKYKEIGLLLENMDEKEQNAIHGKKICYEHAHYKYEVENDESIKARYSGMIKHVHAWNPKYLSEDKKFGQDVACYFENHKKFAKQQLIEDKNHTCHTDEYLKYMKEEYEQKIKTLQNMSPSDLIYTLCYKYMSKRIDLGRQVKEKLKNQTIESTGPSALKNPETARVSQGKTV